MKALSKTDRIDGTKRGSETINDDQGGTSRRLLCRKIRTLQQTLFLRDLMLHKFPIKSAS
eukprot:6457305-Amphidinium_carterae.1